jgi:aspartyl-tRNA(Asn)/glutamyl-tRNA(Gln) amidotransferase subunit C
MGHEEKRPGVDREWIQKTSRLSRLKLTEDELAELLPQLGQILDHVDQLRAVPTDGIEPFMHPLLELLPGSETRAFREDRASNVTQENDPSSAILECAPELTDRAFQVPQAVPQGGGRSK